MKDPYTRMAMGMTIDVAVGMVVGATLLDDMALGVGIGIAVGAGVGGLLYAGRD